MPVTFNTNNNYNVDIITEPDVLNPTVIKYSSTSNTPYVELKITADIYQYPLLAGNMNFDSLTRFIDHNATNNVNNTCVPPLTPHGVKSTSPYNFTPIAGQLANGTMCLLPQVTNPTRVSYQGPYQTNRPSAGIYNDKIADGVAWTKVIWVEVYEDDNGQMVNTAFSPELDEDLAKWQLWDPNNPSKTITNNVYPQYIRAFVFLEFASGGPSSLTSNVDIFIDIDEEEPIYGCTDPNADNPTTGATIDDGSCLYTGSTFSLPSFTLTANPPSVALQGNLSGNLSIITNIFWMGRTWALMSFELNVSQATNIPTGSTSVDYNITELYYLDRYGAQVSLNYMPTGSTLTPPYNLTGSGFNYVFQNNNTTHVQLFTTPTPITASVLFSAPYNIDGVIFLNPPLNTSSQSWPIDIICTVEATSFPGGQTASSTQTFSINI